MSTGADILKKIKPTSAASFTRFKAQLRLLCSPGRGKKRKVRNYFIILQNIDQQAYSMLGPPTKT
jgi:hypothetical protein